MSETISEYYDEEGVQRAVGSNGYRGLVGGHWDLMGELQFSQMLAHGLTPDHKLLDIGCGALRGGVHFVKYLEPAHYFGTDLNRSLLDAGYDKELGALDLQGRLPRQNLHTTSEFDFAKFDETFDRAIAFSLFTHLPLDVIRTCLERLADVMRPGGVFYATFFEAPENQPTFLSINHAPGEVTTYAGRDPYHQRYRDYLHMTEDLPWDVGYIGEFEHPRGQRMISFTRQGDAEQTEQSVRGLSVQEATQLAPGTDHYRAFVGPPDRFDFIGASQFNLLFQLGLRDTDSVLDFGCGSLRLGRLLIPFLQKGNYAGLDPNRWLIEDGIDRELGRSAIGLKAPEFAYNSDFNSAVFGKQFDFIIAQSIVTHTGPDLMRAMFSQIGEALDEKGLFLFSYIRTPDNPDEGWPDAGWHYPACVGYTDAQLISELRAAGLAAKPVGWYHPAAAWMLVARDATAIPDDERLQGLTGVVVSDRA